MKILVTGALGHIGSSVIRRLPFQFPGSEVLMVDNMLTQRYPSLFDLPKEGRYRFIEGDVITMDKELLMRDVDVVVHLAAITDATSSFENAEEVERNNLQATRVMAEACVEAGAALIMASSTSVYGTQEEQVDENCPDSWLKPQSPYAETKMKEEELVTGIVRQQGLKAVIFRYGTIFGTSPGMRFHTAVNKFCWQAVMGTPLTVWTTAYEQKRPYLHLDDCVDAIGFAIDRHLFDGRVYNVVTENASVKQVVDHIRSHVPTLEVKFVESRIMNQLSYEVLNTRLTEAGFGVRRTLGEGIADSIALLRNANGV